MTAAMSDEKRCATCQRPNGPGGAEVRPYGEGGELICFDCMMGTPGAIAEAERQFSARLDRASKLTRAAMLTEEGPIPFVVRRAPGKGTCPHGAPYSPIVGEFCAACDRGVPAPVEPQRGGGVMVRQEYIDRLASSAVRVWLPAGMKGGFVYLSDGSTKKVREETMTALGDRDLFDDDVGGDGLRNAAGIRRVPFGILYGRLYKGPPWRPSDEVLTRCERRGIDPVASLERLYQEIPDLRPAPEPVTPRCPDSRCKHLMSEHDHAGRCRLYQCGCMGTGRSPTPGRTP